MGCQQRDLPIEFALRGSASRWVAFGLFKHMERFMQGALIAIDRLSPRRKLARSHQGLGRE